jgi:peroxiredoxin
MLSRGIWIFIIGAVLSLPAFALRPGQSAPEFSLAGIVGAPVTLADARDKVVIVDFWASWCGPCQRSLPWLETMLDRYGAQGFTVIAINLDRKRSDADRFLARIPLKLPLAFDASGVTAKNYGVNVMPSSFLIGRDSKIHAIHPGFRDIDSSAREAEIQRLLAKPQ